jgi:hypothetical protein
MSSDYTNHLYRKYHIAKVDGTPIDPAAQYFVLRIDTDPAARQALLHYAKCIEATNPQFAAELRGWVGLLQPPSELEVTQ